MNNDLLGTRKGKILIFLLSGPKMMTELKNFISSYDVLRYNILELQTDGYVIKKENRDDKRKFLVSLTDKGREMALRLKQAQDAAAGKQPPEPDNEKQENSNPEPTEGVIHFGDEDINIKLEPEERMNSKYLKLLIHSNVLDDHITVEEAIPGRPTRIFNIYIRQNGHGYFRLWCEEDHSFDCWHVKEAWTYPAVQKMMMEYKYKTKVCPYCKTVNDLDADYCKHCGAKLE